MGPVAGSYRGTFIGTTYRDVVVTTRDLAHRLRRREAAMARPIDVRTAANTEHGVVLRLRVTRGNPALYSTFKR